MDRPPPIVPGGVVAASLLLELEGTMNGSFTRRFTAHAISRITGVVIAAGLILGGWTGAIHAQTPMGQVVPNTGDLEVIKIRPNVYVIYGAGGNIVAHTGWMGVVLVDTGAAGNADKILTAIKGFSDQRIRFIYNTSAEPDHVGNNAPLAKAGLNLLRFNLGDAFGGGGGGLQINSPAAEIMANENVLNRMSAPSGRQAPFPSEAWPTLAVTNARNRSLYLNGDGVQFIPQPAAHSDADSMVFFRKADVIVTGDILDLRHFPVIDVDKGGSIQGEIDSLTRLIELSVPPAPFVWHEDRTLIVPGHGRVCDQGDVVNYRDMLAQIRDRVQDGINKKMTLEQIKKSNPTQGWNKQFGRDSGPWTTDMFVTAVYRTLGGK
jgi:glyoxylase-like metal-dependent hydrolase (beta-lactamase superfamily II)